MTDIDVLIVGGGPAGLATAIRLKQKLREANREETVVVIDKGHKIGDHNLSGAVFEHECLDELIPGWREEKDAFVQNLQKVEKDEMYFLLPENAIKIPEVLVPKPMHHEKDVIISINQLTKWLGKVAEREGAEIYPGFSGKEPIIENGTLRGVRLVDLGIGHDGKPKSNYLKGEEIRAKVTVVSDGSRGVVSGKLTEAIGAGKNPQVYSVGVKELIKLPKDNNFGNNRILHTLGFPNKMNVFGGGFMYSMGEDVVAVGLILGLDWKYQDLDPQKELQIFKSHKFIAKLLEGGQVIMAGSKTIPEGGYYALPELVTDGGMIVGDSAGFVNMEKIKGIHYGVRSGICAADAIFSALLKNDFSKDSLNKYNKNLEDKKIIDEMYHARNFRQCFKYGLPVGAPLSNVQSLIPFKMGMEKDSKTTKSRTLIDRKFKGGIDKATAVSLSGTIHREDEPSHLKILDAKLCQECTEKYGNPCVSFCPGEVYRMKDGEMILSASNCLHDGSCAVKCPYDNIEWTPPEGGEGPRYKKM